LKCNLRIALRCQYRQIYRAAAISNTRSNLAEAALRISAEEYPGLAVQAYLDRLNAFAEEVRSRLGNDCAPARIVQVLNSYLFQELGFAGDTADFYDPRNSFLNDVLDRRRGIPITLSLVYIEVGRRVGLDVVGISFPGHFLVKYRDGEFEVVLDPYAGGVMLTHEELSVRLQRLYGHRAPEIGRAPWLLEAATNEEILVRMLRNLKGVYLYRNELRKALRVVDRILAFQPDLSTEIRDRGKIYQKLECSQAALADFRRYLQLNKDAEDAAAVRSAIIDLESSARYLH